MAEWQRWAESDDQTLLDMIAADASLQEIARTLGRTPTSIEHRISLLKKRDRLPKDVKIAGRDERKPWTEEEDSSLKIMMAAGAGSSEIAQALGRSVSSVKSRIYALKLK